MTCPVPGCMVTPPRRNVFCPEHYFQIPTIYTRVINRTLFACERAATPDERDHLEKQLDGYILVAIRHLRGGHGA